MADDPCKGCSGCGASCPSAEEQAKQQAEATAKIKAIVEKHGGTAELDESTGVFTIDVPNSKKEAIAKEIMETMGLRMVI